jgi:RraA family protein
MPNIGFRVFTRINRPPQALVEAFSNLPVANIADEMNRLWCMDARIRPLNKAPLLGPAFTVRARVGDNLMLHAAIDLAEPGDVIVVEDQGDLANALIGENMMLWAARRRLGGMVVDGAMRDVECLSQMNFPCYAAGIQPKGPYKDGPGEINVPISCGGVVVTPGDIVVGDADGIVVIPPRDAADVATKARKKLEAELATRKAIADGTWNRTPYTLEALAAKGCEIIDDAWTP